MENEKTLLKSVANISKELMEEQEKVLGRLCLLSHGLENYEWMDEKKYEHVIEEMKAILLKQSDLKRVSSNLQINENTIKGTWKAAVYALEQIEKSERQQISKYLTGFYAMHARAQEELNQTKKCFDGEDQEQKKKAAEKLLKIAKIYEEKDDEKKFLLILKSGSLEPAILFALNKDLIRNDEERCDLSRINEILQDEMLDKRNRAEHQTIIAGKKLGKEQSTHAFLTVLDCSLLASNAGKSLLSRILKERICQRADLETAKSGQKDKKRALYDKKDPFSFEAQKKSKNNDPLVKKETRGKAQRIMHVKSETVIPELRDRSKEKNGNERLEDKDPMLVVSDLILRNKKEYALSYLHALSELDASWVPVYRQFALAVDDPAIGEEITTDTLFKTFGIERNESQTYVYIAAALRDIFYDQMMPDYSLQALGDDLESIRMIKQISGLQEILYLLIHYKKEAKHGIDQNADYKQKEKKRIETEIKMLQKEAENIYELKVSNYTRSTVENARFLKTQQMIFARDGGMAFLLEMVINDDLSCLEVARELLKEQFIKEGHEVCKENIDPSKIDFLIDDTWNHTTDRLGKKKQSSRLKSIARQGLINSMERVLRIVTEYVRMRTMPKLDVESTSYAQYLKIKDRLIILMESAVENLKHDKKDDVLIAAGMKLLEDTIDELKRRLLGDYEEKEHEYFYRNMFVHSSITFDVYGCPEFLNIPFLPNSGAYERIWALAQESSISLESYFDEICGANVSELVNMRNMWLIGKYLEKNDIDFFNEENRKYCHRLFQDKYKRFKEDLELASAYGRLDDEFNQDTRIRQMLESWAGWADETENFGFFIDLCHRISDWIKSRSLVRSKALKERLFHMKEEHVFPESQSELYESAYKEVDKRISAENYAAAEDLINRVSTDDLQVDDLQLSEDLNRFIDEYESLHREISDGSTTLASRKRFLIKSVHNKEARMAEKLLNAWPKGRSYHESEAGQIFDLLGFDVENVVKMDLVSGRYNSFDVLLKKKRNKSLANYVHYAPAFGSKACDTGITLMVLLGKFQAQAIMDCVNEMDMNKPLIIFLDSALQMVERRSLAKEMKKHSFGMPVLVVDRGIISYIIKHYSDRGSANRMLLNLTLPYTYYQPYLKKAATIIPPELFMGRKSELERIKDPNGVNLIYGGRQLGKSALLQIAKHEVNGNVAGQRALLVDIKACDYKEAAKKVCRKLCEEGILESCETDSWKELTDRLRERLLDLGQPLPYLLLMMDEADAFIDSCAAVNYRPFDLLKELQMLEGNCFKFVVAGLRNVVRFKKEIALGNNSSLAQLEAMTVKPLRTAEARELLEKPLRSLGFQFSKDEKGERLISMILGTCNYFPGLIQTYCAMLIESMKRSYGGYNQNVTPPYIISEDHIKRVLADEGLQQEIKNKFEMTLRSDEDDYYYLIANLVAYLHYNNKEKSGVATADIMALARELDLWKFDELKAENIEALVEEMRELNIFQLAGEREYQFTRTSFLQMMGSLEKINEVLMEAMRNE